MSFAVIGSNHTNNRWGSNMNYAPRIAVKAYRQEDGMVYTVLPQGTYHIDGKNVVIKGHSETDGGVIIDETALDRVFSVSVDRPIMAYKNVESDLTMNHSDYMTQKEKLLSKSVVDDDEDNDNEMRVWSSIADRHAYELFAELWKPIYGTIEVKTPVFFDVVGEFSTEHPFIFPIRKVSGDFKQTLYRYDRTAHVLSTVEAVLVESGIPRLAVEPPTFGAPRGVEQTSFWLPRGKLDSSKIVIVGKDTLDSTYLTIKIPELKQYEGISGMTGTFAELKAKHDEIELDIRACIAVFVKRANAISDLDGECVADLVSRLNSAIRLLSTVSPMQKSRSDYNIGMKSLRDAKDLLVKDVSKM